MKSADYLRDVLVPANVAVAAIQRAGLPIDVALLRQTRETWLSQVIEMEKMVEAESERVGTPIKYSEKHGVHPPFMSKFLWQGLKLDPRGPNGKPKLTPKGAFSSDGEALAPHASIKRPRPTDNPIAMAILKIRSLSKGFGTYLDSFERTVRSDGACHPQFNWALRTSRLSAQDPPVHQIPERADKMVADGVKACIIPRVKPALDRSAWDPRIHGSCWRWDIAGAEAAIRAAMLTDRFGVRDPIAYEYIRLGKDIHSKTASLLYQVAEGTYKKGSHERDSVGKPVFFAKIFGAKWRAVQHQMWDEARLWIPDKEMERLTLNFDKGYVGLTQLYDLDKIFLGERMDENGLSWVEDPYGRRRAIQIPAAARVRYHDGGWDEGNFSDYQVQKSLNHAFHVAANTPTQSCNAADTLWMLALLHHGEYVELRVPPMWERDGVLFPEAKAWQLNGGDGPGGKPFQSWHMNTVHDSGWGDCAPGYIEPTMKVITRRCTAVPLDWRIQADVPYRVDLQIGPDMSRLMPYNKAAKLFDLEPMPER